MVTDSVPEIPETPDTRFDRGLLAIWRVRECPGKVGPEGHLAPGDQLVPESERDLRDDLAWVDRLVVATNSADRRVDVEV